MNDTPNETPAGPEVKRYVIEMPLQPDGLDAKEYVRASDYDSLAAQLKEARERIVEVQADRDAAYREIARTDAALTEARGRVEGLATMVLDALEATNLEMRLEIWKKHAALSQLQSAPPQQKE